MDVNLKLFFIHSFTDQSSLEAAMRRMHLLLAALLCCFAAATTTLSTATTTSAALLGLCEKCSNDNKCTDDFFCCPFQLHWCVLVHMARLYAHDYRHDSSPEPRAHGTHSRRCITSVYNATLSIPNTSTSCLCPDKTSGKYVRMVVLVQSSTTTITPSLGDAI